MKKENRIAVKFPPYKGGLVELKDGRIMGLSRGLVKYYSEDRGRTWSQPEQVLQDGKSIKAEGDPVSVLRLQSGGIGITYSRILEPSELPDIGLHAEERYSATERSALFFRQSKDEGDNWEREFMVSGPGIVWWYALNDTLIQLTSGRLLWPCYGGSSTYSPDPKPKVEGLERGVGHGWHPEFCLSKFFYSDDEGESWMGSEDDLMMWIDNGHGNLAMLGEITAAESRDGNVVALARSEIMRAVMTVSADQGEHWSLPTATGLCSSNAPVRVKTVPSTGDLMVVWNQTTAQEHRTGYGRCRLSAAVSKDSGNTWTNFRTIHVSPGMNTEERITDLEPPQFVRAGSATRPDDPVPDNPIGGQIRASYPNFYFFGDEVFIEHDYWFRNNLWRSDNVPEEWEDIRKGKGEKKLNIFPLEWFY